MMDQDDDELYASSNQKRGPSTSAKARSAAARVRLPSPAIDEQNVSEQGPQSRSSRGGYWLVLTRKGGHFEVLTGRLSMREKLMI
jgi:hypothetical protein